MQVELVMTGPILRLAFPTGAGCSKHICSAGGLSNRHRPATNDPHSSVVYCIGHKEPGYEVALATGIKMAVTTEMRRDW